MGKKGKTWAKFAAVLGIAGGVVHVLTPLGVDALEWLGAFSPIVQVVAGVGGVVAGIMLWNK